MKEWKILNVIMWYWILNKNGIEKESKHLLQLQPSSFFFHGLFQPCSQPFFLPHSSLKNILFFSSKKTTIEMTSHDTYSLDFSAASSEAVLRLSWGCVEAVLRPLCWSKGRRVCKVSRRSSVRKQIVRCSGGACGFEAVLRPSAHENSKNLKICKLKNFKIFAW